MILLFLDEEYDDYYGDEEEGCTSEPEMGRERPLVTRMLRPLSEGESAGDDSENTCDDLEVCIDLFST
jgi:hypothetical protein